jgi:hypothetical protein
MRAGEYHSSGGSARGRLPPAGMAVDSTTARQAGAGPAGSPTADGGASAATAVGGAAAAVCAYGFGSADAAAAVTAAQLRSTFKRPCTGSPHASVQHLDASFTDQGGDHRTDEGGGEGNRGLLRRRHHSDRCAIG